MVRLTDRPDMTLDVNVDVKQQYNNNNKIEADRLEISQRGRK